VVHEGGLSEQKGWKYMHLWRGSNLRCDPAFDPRKAARFRALPPTEEGMLRMVRDVVAISSDLEKHAKDAHPIQWECSRDFHSVVAGFHRLLGLVTCKATFAGPFQHVEARSPLERLEDAAWLLEYLGSLGLAPSKAEGFEGYHGMDAALHAGAKRLRRTLLSQERAAAKVSRSWNAYARAPFWRSHVMPFFPEWKFWRPEFHGQLKLCRPEFDATVRMAVMLDAPCEMTWRW
jgi:hypothetical protein